MLYPEYQNLNDSRFDAAIKIPKDWGERKLKFLVSHNDEVLPESTDADYEIEYVDISSVDLVNGINAYETVSFEKAPSRARRLARDGDTLVSTVRTYLKAIASVTNPPDNLVVSTGFAVIRPREEIDQGYLAYFLQNQNFVEQVVANSVGVSYPAINAADLVCIPAYFPRKIEEQQKIAAFLDYKTQQIDQLIKKKKNLIEKLDEKRIAVITQAVTKGLDKNAKLKPSGVDWLGDVPGGWKVRKLRFIGVCQNGINIGAEFFGRGDPFVSYGDVYNNKELPSSVKGLVQSSDSDKKAYSVETGDILFTRTSETIEEIGFSSVCMETIEDAVFAGFLIRVRPDANEISMKFSKYYFQNILLRAFFVKEMNLVTRASLSQDLLKKLPVLLPSIDEQIIIAKYLDEATSKTEKMVKKVQSAIDKLIEYRAAIVTSAVTGKIDVREVEVPKEVA
jgi:type I restriction enzyme S subunit